MRVFINTAKQRNYIFKKTFPTRYSWQRTLSSLNPEYLTTDRRWSKPTRSDSFANNLSAL